MQLYYSPGACSLSPHIVALEAGLPVKIEKVDLRAKTLADGSDFYAINSKGSVPALKLDSGEVLTEGPAIVQYLADQKPEAGLAPKAGTMERYRLQEWLNFITSEMHKTIGSLFAPAVSPEQRAATVALIEKRLTWLEGQLKDREHLMGKAFSVADAYLFTVLGWTKHLKIDLSGFPAVQTYLGRIAARPQVQAAMRAEGLIK